MSYKIALTDNFKKEAKQLSKKYPSLKADLEAFSSELSENPTIGTNLGNNIYKIRLAIKSKGKGKSGGARVLTQIKVVNKTIYLISIYDKAEKDCISDHEIKELLKQL
jgi:mRNA-degrading endonuclease RelE of RelBE toxin-antitoxin system